MNSTDANAIRVRFAPSPTGYLHVGGARTALFNWLIARKHAGTFILRIEDTDVQRSSQEMVEIILNSMRWLRLDWDEGPYFQSARLDHYRLAARTLLTNGKAYRCFCKPEDLAARREAGMKLKGSWKYERLCLQLSAEESEAKEKAGEPFAIRFLVAPGRTAFQDVVHGEISLDHENVDDFVLLRSDRHPTYHLSVVVDDIEMGITMVLRGDDHISNTPKQILLYEAFGKAPPQFAHLPLILGPDKKRLSKRHGSVAVEEYRNQGILPEALFNFLALLGWNPGDEREVMIREELIAEFRLEQVNSSNAVFDLKKLQWMNGKYLAMAPLSRVLELIHPYLEDPSWGQDPNFPRRMDLMRTRAVTLVDLAKMMEPFYRADFSYESTAWDKVKKDASLPALLEQFLSILESAQWDQPTLEACLRDFVAKAEVKAATLIHPLRLALTGKSSGPGLFELMEAMGKENTLLRLRRFLRELQSTTDTTKP